MVIHAGIQRFLNIIYKSICRQSYNWNRNCIGPLYTQGSNGFCCLVSIHVWHHNIHQNKIVCASRMIFKQIHNFYSV